MSGARQLAVGALGYRAVVQDRVVTAARRLLALLALSSLFLASGGLRAAAVAELPVPAQPAAAAGTGGAAGNVQAGAVDTRGAAKSVDSRATLPYVLTVRGANGVATIAADLPEDARPIEFTGRIAANYTSPGTVSVFVGDRRAAEVDATSGGTVRFALTAADLVDGAVELTMSVALQPQRECFPDQGSSASLEDGEITFSHPTTAPRTIGAFLAGGVASYQVVIPERPTDPEVEAGLDAVAALTYRYPLPTRATLLATKDAPKPTYLNRVLVITQVDSATGNTMAVDPSGVLRISGPPQTLAPAAIALGDPNTDLLQTATATSVLGTPAFEVITGAHSVGSLGQQPISMSGVGQLQSTLRIGQPTFGQPVGQFDFRLVGSMTTIPRGAEGRVDFLWNGTLARSVQMTGSSELDVRLSFQGLQVRRNNNLVVQLSYAPAVGCAAAAPLPARVDIDPWRSTVTASAGSSVPAGFERFPQVFPGVIPVAFGSNGSRASLVGQAGDLVASLQSADSQQLVAESMDQAAFLSQNRAGVLVGGDGRTAAELKAPVSGNGDVTIGTDGSQLTLTAGPYGALQAFESGPRNLVLLTGIAPSGQLQPAADARAAKLAEFADAAPDRWTTLTGQALLQGAADTPVSVGSRPPAPAPGWTPTPLFLAVIAAGLLVGGALFWQWWRPRKG